MYKTEKVSDDIFVFKRNLLVIPVVGLFFTVLGTFFVLVTTGYIGDEEPNSMMALGGSLGAAFGLAMLLFVPCYHTIRFDKSGGRIDHKRTRLIGSKKAVYDLNEADHILLDEREEMHKNERKILRHFYLVFSNGGRLELGNKNPGQNSVALTEHDIPRAVRQLQSFLDIPIEIHSMGDSVHEQSQKLAKLVKAFKQKDKESLESIYQQPPEPPRFKDS